MWGGTNDDPFPFLGDISIPLVEEMGSRSRLCTTIQGIMPKIPFGQGARNCCFGMLLMGSVRLVALPCQLLACCYLIYQHLHLFGAKAASLPSYDLS